MLSQAIMIERLIEENQQYAEKVAYLQQEFERTQSELSEICAQCVLSNGRPVQFIKDAEIIRALKSQINALGGAEARLSRQLEDLHAEPTTDKQDPFDEHHEPIAMRKIRNADQSDMVILRESSLRVDQSVNAKLHTFKEGDLRLDDLSVHEAF